MIEGVPFGFALQLVNRSWILQAVDEEAERVMSKQLDLYRMLQTAMYPEGWRCGWCTWHDSCMQAKQQQVNRQNRSSCNHSQQHTPLQHPNNYLLILHNTLTHQAGWLSDQAASC
jgi:hypothetical protein